MSTQALEILLKANDQATKVIAGIQKTTNQLAADTQRFATKSRADLNALFSSWAGHQVELTKGQERLQQSLGATAKAIGILGGAAAATGAALIALGKRGSEIVGVEQGFQATARAAKESTEAMLAASRGATRGLVSDFDLMTAANKAYILGLPASSKEMANLGEVAIALGQKMRVGPGEAINALVEGFGKGSAEILNNLGIVVRAEDAYQRFAAANNKSAEALTAQERSLAIFTVGMDAAQKKVAEMGGVQLSFGERLTQITVGVQNFIDRLSSAVATSPAVNKALAAIAESMQKAFGGDQKKVIAELVAMVDRAAIALVDYGSVAVRVAQYVTNGFLGLKALFQSITGYVLSGMASIADLILKLPLQAMAKMPAGFMGGIGEFARAMLPLREQLASFKGAAKDMREQFDETAGSMQKNERAADVAVKALGDLKASMIEAAKKGADSLTAALDGGGSGGGGAAGGGVNGALDRTRAAVERFKAATASGNWADGLFAIGEKAATWWKSPAFSKAMTPATAGGGLLDFASSMWERMGANVNAGSNGGMMDWAFSFGEKVSGQIKAALGKSLGASFSDAFKALPQTIMSALQGGGNVLQSVGSLFGSSIFGQGSKLVDGITGGLKNLLGKGLGGALGSVIPGLGTLLGGAVGGLFGKLFGGDQTKKQLAELRQQLLDQFGGSMDALRKKAGELGVNIDRAFTTKSPKELQATIEKLNKAMEEQKKKLEALSIAAQGFVGLAKEWGKEIAESGATEEMQAQFDRLGLYATAIFAGIVRETGDVIGAFKQIGEGLSEMRKRQEEFGLSASETTQKLLDLYGIVENNEGAANALSFLNQMMTGLVDAGMKSQQLFSAFGADAVKIFNDLVAGGATSNQALALMQPTLQRLWEMHHDLGYEVDANTKKLLDQAEEQGLVGDNMRSVNDKILQVLLAIGEALGATIPDALRKTGDAAEREFGRFRDAAEGAGDALPGGGRPGGFNQDWPDADHYGLPGYATGGYIPHTPGGKAIRVAEEPGGEWVFTRSQLKGLLSEVSDRGGSGGATRVQVFIGDREINDYVVKLTNEGLADGRVRVPARAIAERNA
jgi:hypothetical protein